MARFGPGSSYYDPPVSPTARTQVSRAFSHASQPDSALLRSHTPISEPDLDSAVLANLERQSSAGSYLNRGAPTNGSSTPKTSGTPSHKVQRKAVPSLASERAAPPPPPPSSPPSSSSGSRVPSSSASSTVSSSVSTVHPQDNRDYSMLRLVNYLQGQEQVRQGQTTRMTSQMDRIEHKVDRLERIEGKLFRLDRMDEKLDKLNELANRPLTRALSTASSRPPPVPSKDDDTESIDVELSDTETERPPSPALSDGSSASADSERPVTPTLPSGPVPFIVPDSLNQRLDDMSNLLGTVLGQQRDILDQLNQGKRDRGMGMMDPGHSAPVEDMLRQILSHLGTVQPRGSFSGSTVGSEFDPTSFYPGGSVYGSEVGMNPIAPPNSVIGVPSPTLSSVIPESLLNGSIEHNPFDYEYATRNLPPAQPPMPSQRQPAHMPEWLRQRQNQQQQPQFVVPVPQPQAQIPQVPQVSVPPNTLGDNEDRTGALDPMHELMNEARVHTPLSATSGALTIVSPDKSTPPTPKTPAAVVSSSPVRPPRDLIPGPAPELIDVPTPINDKRHLPSSRAPPVSANAPAPGPAPAAPYQTAHNYAPSAGMGPPPPPTAG
jgi:hypothetical protein